MLLNKVAIIVFSKLKIVLKQKAGIENLRAGLREFLNFPQIGEKCFALTCGVQIKVLKWSSRPP